MTGKKKLLEARVTHVSDGDTLRVDVSGLTVTVRLDSVDAPEKNQPHGPQAREALAALVMDREVRIEQTAQDRYGRLVGKVWRGRTYVNAELVRNGHVWVYEQYCNEPDFPKLQEQARKAEAGLWALPKSQRMPPQEWRRQGGNSKAAEPADKPKEKSSKPASRRKRSSRCNHTLLPWVLGAGVAGAGVVAWLWYSGRVSTWLSSLPF